MTGTGSVAYSSHESAGLVITEPQLYYIHTDHLGTPQELTDRDGNLQWIGQYRAWGELAKASDSEGNAASVEMPLRFQGQYCDAETGLHYNRFRYYDPQVGRFTTQDPISLVGGINLYQYAPNPVQWVDPFGLAKKPNGECPLKNVQKLPPLKGKSTSHVEEILECNGYTCKTPQNPKNRRWVHEDGSEVQVHGYGGQKTTPHTSGNNAHAHKSIGKHLDRNGTTVELADDGLTRVSPYSDEAHIGLKNPSDFSNVSGRSHGI